MIEARGLTKRFGQVVAVDGLTFPVGPGEVTGFLGRNGAGKTTTLRMILGLERPASGTVTVDGQPYAELAAPLRQVGSLLDARAVQPGCSASEHLLALARSNGIDRRRVGEVLETVGLGKVGRKLARTFSLGMLQRLGFAAALLGDPPILLLDEPLNTSFAVSGLDGSTIGALALRAGVELHELTSVRRSLEDAFMELTAPSDRAACRPGQRTPA